MGKTCVMVRYKDDSYNTTFISTIGMGGIEGVKRERLTLNDERKRGQGMRVREQRAWNLNLNVSNQVSAEVPR